MNWFVADKKTEPLLQEYPEIKVNEQLKKIEITGHSCMSDPIDYYNDLTGKLEKQYVSFNKRLILDFHLEYINTSSIKLILALLTNLQKMAENKGIIEVNWFFEEDDETILETGEVFGTFLRIPFHLIEIV